MVNIIREMREIMDRYAETERGDPDSHLTSERMTIVLPDMSASDAYRMYRLMLNMINYKNDLAPTRSNDSGVLTFYAQEHLDIVKQFLDDSGIRYEILDPSDAKEPADTNTVSPVPKNPWWGSS